MFKNILEIFQDLNKKGIIFSDYIDTMEYSRIVLNFRNQKKHIKFNSENFIEHLSLYKNDSFPYRVVISGDNNIYKIELNKTKQKTNATYSQPLDFLFSNVYNKKVYLVSPKINSLSVLVKPTCDCNLSCYYCYDMGARKEFAGQRLSVSDIEKFVKLLTNYTRTCQWIWHGGEVLLMGKKWFREVYEKIFPKYSMCTFNFSLVSNGIVWDEEWILLLNKYNIALSTSFNAGNQCAIREHGLHPNFIPNLKKKGTVEFFEDDKKESVTWKSIELYKKVLNQDTIGLIDVITQESLPYLIEIDKFYKRNKISAVFNDCFDTENLKTNNKEKLVADLNTYSKYFEEYLVYWLYDTDEKYNNTRIVDTVIESMVGLPSLCHYSDCRKTWIGLHPDGSITPCDRLVPDKYKYGNINNIEDLSEIYKQKGFNTYYKDIEKRFNTYCKECGHYKWCGGGCHGTIIENNKGDASQVYTVHCYTEREKFRLIYKHIREIDIYSDKINPKLKQIFFTNWIYTTREIKEYFKELNIPYKFEYHFEYIANSDEFELFYDITQTISYDLQKKYRVYNYSEITKEIRKQYFLNSLSLFKKSLMEKNYVTK